MTTPTNDEIRESIKVLKAEASLCYDNIKRATISGYAESDDPNCKQYLESNRSRKTAIENTITFLEGFLD